MGHGVLPGLDRLTATRVFAFLALSFNALSCGCFLVFHRFQDFLGIGVADARLLLRGLILIFILLVLILLLFVLVLVLILVLILILLVLVFVLLVLVLILVLLVLVLVLILLLLLLLLLGKTQVCACLFVVGILSQGIFVIFNALLEIVVVEGNVSEIVGCLLNNQVALSRLKESLQQALRDRKSVV